jgi:hypothetical protein
MATSTKSTTNKKKKMFLEVFKNNGANISATCNAIKIDRQTYYNWYKKDEKFKKQVEEIKESLIDFAESMLLKKIKKEDLGAIIFFLKTKGKSRGYTERQEIEHSGVESQIHIYLPQKEDIK